MASGIVDKGVGALRAISEPLQSFSFWLMDVAPIDALATPIFIPTLGFQSITAPEMTAEVKSIKEGNWYFTRKVLTGHVETNTINLKRGVRFFDSDFSRWFEAGMAGNPLGIAGTSRGLGRIGGPTPRRTMLLIQFFPRVTHLSPTAAIGATLPQSLALAGLVGSAVIGAGAGAGAGSLGPGMIGTGLAAGADIAHGMGPFDLVARIPAKAWVLHGCIPTRYKVASDFDAKSAEVSIAELDLQYEMLEEVSLTA